MGALVRSSTEERDASNHQSAFGTHAWLARDKRSPTTPSLHSLGPMLLSRNFWCTTSERGRVGAQLGASSRKRLPAMTRGGCSPAPPCTRAPQAPARCAQSHAWQPDPNHGQGRWAGCPPPRSAERTTACATAQDPCASQQPGTHGSSSAANGSQRSEAWQGSRTRNGACEEIPPIKFFLPIFLLALE